MADKKKLMVLGASYSQIPLMEAAKRLGYHVIAVSIPGPYAGFSHADEVVYADITDREAVLKAALEKKIDGITTCCMDLGTEAMGYVNEKMGLFGPGQFAALAAKDKSVEKAAYEKAGVPTARHFVVHDAAELEEALQKLHFPVIVKAVDLTGSRGIRRADTPWEALSAFDYAMKATKKDFCIVEQFLVGTMFGVEAMMSQGKLAYMLPLGNDLLDGNPPFPVGHYVPWAEGEKMRAQIEELVLGVAKALGFDNCAMDLDCMLADGRPWVIEATARAGATCITDTVSIYYGFDYFEAIVKTALGIDVTDLFRQPEGMHTPNVSRLLFSGKDGKVKKITVPAALPEGVADLSFNISEGDTVRRAATGADRIGQLIVKGRSLEECRALQKKILPDIRIEYDV